jgi:hypothetical protein
MDVSYELLTLTANASCDVLEPPCESRGYIERPFAPSRFLNTIDTHS